MLIERFKNIPIILGSQSPRRKELLAKLGVDFEVVVKETDENFDAKQSPREIVEHLAINKVKAFDNVAFSDQLVITADMVVVCGTDILGNPRDAAEAFEMLSRLHGGSHKVLTAVALQYQGELRAF